MMFQQIIAHAPLRQFHFIKYAFAKHPYNNRYKVLNVLTNFISDVSSRKSKNDAFFTSLEVPKVDKIVDLNGIQWKINNLDHPDKGEEPTSLIWLDFDENYIENPFFLLRKIEEILYLFQSINRKGYVLQKFDSFTTLFESLLNRKVYNADDEAGKKFFVPKDSFNANLISFFVEDLKFGLEKIKSERLAKHEAARIEGSAE